MTDLPSRHVHRKYYLEPVESGSTLPSADFDHRYGDTGANPDSKWSRELSADTAGKRLRRITQFVDF